MTAPVIIFVCGLAVYLLGRWEKRGRDAVDTHEEWPPAWLWEDRDD